MPQYVFDTNHASAIWKEDEHVRSVVLQHSHATFGLCRPSIAELWFMVYNSNRIETNVRAMEDLINTYRKWEFDADAAREFGKIKAELRRIGKMIPAMDLQIAAIARAKNLTLLTADKHFSYVTNLSTENWLA